jgi:hypothetical protein
MAQRLPPVPQLAKEGFTDPVWSRWLNLLQAQVVDALQTLNVNNQNGFSGTTVTLQSTGAVTLTIATTVSGIVKGSGGALSAAVAGDFPLLNQNTTGNAGGLTGTPSIAVSTFGCNGKSPQSSVGVNAASTDLTTVIALCNQLRAALVANGITV